MAKSKNYGMAIIAYFIFFLPLLTDAKKDEFVRYHVRQGAGWLATFVILRFITIVILSPGLFIFAPLLILINIFLLALLVIGVINAAQGKKKPLPLVGKWADELIKL